MKIGIAATSTRRQGGVGRRTRAGVALGVGGLLLGVGGCEVDSFLDPSVIGRWEFTPTVMPVLDRLSSVEDEPGEFVQTTPIRPGDLVPEAEQYRFTPGDELEIHIRDFFTIGLEEVFTRIIDSRGYLDIPRLPPVRASGRTIHEVTTAVEDAIKAQRINERPVVSINIRSQRKQTFSVLGAVQNPGTYYVPAPDYRLLEGITTAGGFDENLPFIYIIRQVYLTDEAAGIVPVTETTTPRVPGAPRPTTPAPERSKPPDESLIELIDELSKQQPKENKPNPALFMQDARPASPARVAPAAPESREPAPPPIDLPDTTVPSTTPAPSPEGGSGWVYVDGKWVKTAPGPDDQADPSQPGGVARSQVTQRVLKVPTAPLLAGAAEVNVVIRPGDVVRIPPMKTGLVYLAGQLSRPGPYSIPAEGRLTLLRAIDSAGGLNGVAIPERVDITRRIGEDRQATVRLNLRAIAEQTQPDIYLKPDDRINVGTNLWATPLAIIRNGFRLSYGFGFILDRNFSSDIFGPENVSNPF